MVTGGAVGGGWEWVGWGEKFEGKSSLYPTCGEITLFAFRLTPNELLPRPQYFREKEDEFHLEIGMKDKGIDLRIPEILKVDEDLSNVSAFNKEDSWG